MVPCELVVVTAADRAAATLRHEGDGTPRPLRGHLPFQGRLCVEAYPKGSLCGGSSPPRQSLHTPIAGKPMVCAIGFPAIHFSQAPHVRGGSVSRRGHNQVYRRRAQLSGGTTYAEARPPNAIRSSGEGVWGRGASLREAASPPEFPSRIYLPLFSSSSMSCWSLAGFALPEERDIAAPISALESACLPAR